MQKYVYVASQIQKSLLTKVLIPAMKYGYWKNHRPALHWQHWDNVEILVSENNTLGCINFIPPRLYNFINPEFMSENSVLILNLAREIKPEISISAVRKELIELSRIIGGRIKNRFDEPTKLYRGEIKVKTVENNSIVDKPDLSKNLKKPAINTMLPNSWLGDL